MPKIVLIENQFREFNKFRISLDKGTVEIFPTPDEYKNFIDHVRVALNPRYDELRKPAKLKVIEMIRNFKPDLLIVDHILVGNHTGETGIALAMELRQVIDKPIIFLSRTVRNDIDVCINLPKILPQESVLWVPKGYPGSDFTEDPFFSNEIMPAIAKMLAWKPKENITQVVKPNTAKLVGEWLIAYMGEQKSFSSDTVKENAVFCKELNLMIENGKFNPDDKFFQDIQREKANEYELNTILNEKLTTTRSK